MQIINWKEFITVLNPTKEINILKNFLNYTDVCFKKTAAKLLKRLDMDEYGIKLETEIFVKEIKWHNSR